ncbi:acetylornithine aminotransferase [Penicillium verhagenii]|nr:acetylornithine aminotransferase [Penicillium verhagenii]
MTSTSGPFSSLSTHALQTRLSFLIQEYEQTHAKSRDASKRAQKVLPAGSTRSVLVSDPFPLVVKSAQAATFTTVDDVTFEDFVSDYSAGIYGHSHPVIYDAVQEALFTGFSLGGITGKEAELAEILVNRFPSMDKVRFCNSGTEANTFAIATAMASTQRKKILVFDNGYHGGTLSFSTRNNPMNLPHEFVVGTYNNIEKTRPLIKDLAAILVEPLQAAGGMHLATKQFLSYLREAATQTGAVLIFDEVVTSRLDYHGIQGLWNIIPDMTTVGKYLGGGFPFGAFGGSATMMDRFDSTDGSIALHHSGTFNNNIFTMCAAVAAAKLITPLELERLNAMGELFRHRVGMMIKEQKFTQMELSGYGSAIGIHFQGPASDVLKDLFYFTLLDRGISIGRRGFVSLNLMHSNASIDRLVEAVEIFFGELARIVIQSRFLN